MGGKPKIIRCEEYWLEKTDDGKTFGCVLTRKHGKKIIVRIPLEESLERIKEAG